MIRNGELHTILRPGFPGSDEPLPDISVEEATAAAATQPSEPFTVETTDGSERYRVLAEPGEVTATWSWWACRSRRSTPPATGSSSSWPWASPWRSRCWPSWRGG